MNSDPKTEYIEKYLRCKADYEHKYKPINEVDDILEVMDNLKHQITFDALFFLNSLHEDMVGMVFLLCRRLDVSPRVRFLSLDIFGHFYKVHFEQVQKLINREPKEIQQSQTKMAVQRMVRQTPLRAFTCVMIAQKFVNGKLPGSYIKNAIHCLNMHFTPDIVIKSEMRIFNETNYRLPRHSLYNMAGLLVYLISYDSVSNYFVMFNHLPDIIDVLFIKFAKIHPQICDIAGKHSVPVKDIPFALACGIVGFLARNCDLEKNEEICEKIGERTKIATQCIVEIRNKLNKVISVMLKQKSPVYERSHSSKNTVSSFVSSKKSEPQTPF